MAIVSKYLFDGRVRYEYRPGKSVKMRFDGITITVYKPGALDKWNSYVYTGPKITLAANPTAVLNISYLKLMHDCISFGVDTLNKEGTNLIDVRNWKDEFDYIDKDSAKVAEVKSEKHKWYKPQINQIFFDGRHTFMYLGKGEMYSRYKNSRQAECENFYDCYECYLNLGYVSLSDVFMGPECINIRTDEKIRFDSARNPRKAYEILKTLNPNISVYNYIFKGELTSTIKMRRE